MPDRTVSVKIRSVIRSTATAIHDALIELTDYSWRGVKPAYLDPPHRDTANRTPTPGSGTAQSSGSSNPRCKAKLDKAPAIVKRSLRLA